MLKTKSLNFLGLGLIMLSTSVLYALEVDEKLTVRFLKVSSSKKTILVNRGLEDGLVVGDHAKFFLTNGVVARGIVEQAAPSRSIWSLYRLVDSSDVFEGKVVDIMIASAAKISEDHTRTIQTEETEAGIDTLGIPLADGANDVPKDLDEKEAREVRLLSRGDGKGIPLEELGEEGELIEKAGKDDKTVSRGSRRGYLANLDTSDNSRAQGRGIDRISQWELSGLMTWGSFSTVEENDVEGSEAREGKSNNFSFASSLEKYFPTSSDFWRRISALCFYEYAGSTQTFSNVDGADSSTKQHNLGLGLHYHFQDPFDFENIIVFVSGKLGALMQSTTLADNTSSGNGYFGALGVGVKFYTLSNFGIRLLLDYYGEQSELETPTTDAVTKATTNTVTTSSKSGFKLYAGLSYRW